MPCDEEADRPARSIVPRRTAQASPTTDFFRACRLRGIGRSPPREGTRVAYRRAE